MNSFNGSVFSGEFAEDKETFYLQRVKQLQTESTLSKKQVNQLYAYLQTQSGQSDSFTITVNDQIPVLLNEEEMEQLLEELQVIKGNWIN